MSGADLLVWGKGYHRRLRNVLGLILAAILLAASLVALIVPERFFDLKALLAQTGAPMALIGWAVVLDFSRLLAQPWQIFYLPSWLLTVMIFFRVNDLAVDISSGADPQSRMRKLKGYMWASNLRFVLTNIGLGIALWYFATATDALHKARDWVIGWVA